MANKVPEKLTNYAAYQEGDQWLGTVDIELPDLAALTETVKGAGIAGEVNSPVIGHYESQTVKLNWRTVNGSSISLSKQKTHALDFRGSQQIYNANTGEWEHQPVKVSIRGIPINTPLGKFEVGATTGTSNELECVFIKIEIDGKRVTEIDKYNFVAFMDGEDALEQVRKNMGM